jgi:pimeloyl-ACP methyl ester carboxylesterase
MLAAWTIGRKDAPALIICHGGALDHSAFCDLAISHKDRWRVILWDLPGHGASQPMPPGFSALTCADAMAAVMDYLGVRDAVALGFSFGGVVAQVLARRRPDLIRRLIAYACLSPHLVKPSAPRAAIPALVTGLFGWMTWPAIRKRFAGLCCVSQAGRARVEADMGPVGKAGFMAMALANLAAGDLDLAFRIREGVDLLAGELDSNGKAIRRTFRAFETAYPEARKIIIPAAGHCAHLDQPEAFGKAIGTLLSRAT